MDDFIPVNRPLLGEHEKKYVLDCLNSGWISSEGPYVKQFETKMAARVGRRHGIAVANGSAALDIAVAALEIGPGDEVIMPTFTIISCAAAVVRAGAKPILVDSNAETWNINPALIEERITPRTRAILVVHIYGLPCDMGPIIEIADRHGLAIIEDAAEMHGQTWYEKPCGSLGTISIFSFYPNKHVTTGEGGMVLTDEPHLAERSRSLRNLCFQPDRRFVHEEIGWNYRITNLQAALGCAQLERLDEFVKRKRQLGARYTELLGNVPGLHLPPDKTAYAKSIYWVYGLVLAENVAADAEEVMRRLAQAKIGTRPFFWPMHEQPVLRRMGWYEGEHYPVAERLARRGFYLPSGIGNTDDEIERSADALRSVMTDLIN